MGADAPYPDRKQNRKGRRTHPQRLTRLSLASLLSLSLCSTSPVPTSSDATVPKSSAVAELINEAGAPALAAIIRSSRDQALADGTLPLPSDKREHFRHLFPPEVLDEVRWTVSGARPRIDTLLAGALEYDGAVTLDNVIIFFNEAGIDNTRLWLHELQHVQQYKQKGVDGFARSYLSSWQQIEKRTHAESVAKLKIMEQRCLKIRATLCVHSTDAPFFTAPGGLFG